MTNPNDFTDEQLVAFLDGETEHCPADAITKALTTDAHLAKRIEALSIEVDQVKHAFSGVLDTAPVAPDFLRQEPLRSIKPTSRFGWGSIAAAVILALGIGFGAGQFTSPSPDNGWKQYVAAYQALYSTDTLVSVKTSSEEQNAELARVAAAIGKSIDVSALQIEQSVDYKRAQILNFKGKPLIQLAFLSKEGVPYALCILKAKDGAPKPVQMQNLENMSSASWSRGGYNYLLIGGSDDAVVSKMAQKYAETI
jgi:anti-sigma factor RsiW